MSTFFASTEFLRMQDTTIYSKLEYFVKKRLCICCSTDVAAFHRHRQLVPSYHTLDVAAFHRHCQLVPTYNLFQTGILCSKKAVHLLQRRCRHIPQASLVSTLLPYTPPGVRFLYVGRTLRYFCPLRSSQLDKSKTSYYPPPTTTTPHKIFIMSDEEGELIPEYQLNMCV